MMNTIKGKIASCTAFFFALLLCVGRSPGNLLSDPEPGDWPQLQMDAQRTGRTDAFVPPEYRAAWVLQDPPSRLRKYIDVPDALVGNCCTIQNLVRAVQAYSPG
jgi:hypothetical protein